VAAPCAPWHCVRGRVRKCGGARPFNRIVRKHFRMTGEVHETSRGSTVGAIFGVGLIVVALIIGLPVAVNFPESWPGAVLGLSVAAVGVGLIVAHLKRVRRARGVTNSRQGNAF